MAAVELGPIADVGILGAETAFPARTLDNLEVLRGLPQPARRRAGAPGAAPSTPHRMTSKLSAVVGSGLGARAACMDTRTGCSAGLFALTTAALYVNAGATGKGVALITGAETFSKVLPHESRSAQLSLGDGAAALVVERKEGAALLSAFLETDGALPPTQGEWERGGYLLSGAPDELLQVVPGKYLAALSALFARARLEGRGLDLDVPHQTSAPLIASVCQTAGIPAARAFVNVAEHANIGSAGWMAALCEARAAGRCHDGALVGLAAVGGGMSWGAAVLRW